ncbi:hypothetical protein R3P38DRAFT_2780745 [Favolaschia claudopus]|uniref:Uncharacterized protein n=1 Tax=Favolaschia claudopus TaxID=2862362 RepID=A0AAW0B6J0_9AGAR
MFYTSCGCSLLIRPCASTHFYRDLSTAKRRVIINLHLPNDIYADVLQYLEELQGAQEGQVPPAQVKDEDEFPDDESQDDEPQGRLRKVKAKASAKPKSKGKGKEIDSWVDLSVILSSIRRGGVCN